MRNQDETIRACLRGDECAAALLFAQYKALVYRTAYLMLNDARDAEDVLQEVFVQVFKALATYDAVRSAFSTWLHRITVNTCLTRRRRSVPQTVPLDDEDQAAVDGDPLLQLSLAERAHTLLAALDDDQRAVVILRFYWDLSYAEIAEITAAPLGTVQSRLGRALKKMRTVMQEEG